MITKEDVIKKLELFSTCLELSGANIFKVRAYHNASISLESVQNFKELIGERKLHTIRGIGNDISHQIYELNETGNIKALKDLKSSLPDGLFYMLKIEGLGPKRVRALYKELKIDNLKKLKKACEGGTLLKLNGFGPVLRSNILKGIEFLEKNSQRYTVDIATDISEKVIKKLKTLSKISKIEIAGSLRRKRETVKDIDILISGASPDEVSKKISDMKEFKEFISKGDTKISFKLRNGFHVDIRIVKDNEFVTALHHFTGSKEHNVQLRHLSKEFDIKINEYGLEKKEKVIHPESEEELFNILNMEYIPPELREGRGELEAAKKNRIPKLIQLSDLKGIVHVHTLFSDGKNTLEELADFVKRSGFSYIVVTDHSQSSRIANGMKLDKLHFYLSEIDSINKKYGEKVLVKGIECDILTSGELDYPNHVLENFEVVIGSVHSGFSMDKASMTKRLLRAIDNPYMNVLGHISGRLLTKRKAYDFDKEKVFSSAIDSGVYLEINSNPYRLDVDWRYIKNLKEAGMKFLITPDAHSIEDIENIKYGVGIARKGWLEEKDVINTHEVYDFLKALKGVKA